VLVRYRRSSKLGQLLIKMKAITLDDLATGLKEQRRTHHQRLGQVLLELKHITEEQLRQALSLSSFTSSSSISTVLCWTGHCEHWSIRASRRRAF
jgi:hypothetical protein